MPEWDVEVQIEIDAIVTVNAKNAEEAMSKAKKNWTGVQVNMMSLNEQ